MGSRDKGNGAEREVAKLIEPWWRQLEPEANFVRTPLSGGWGAPPVRAGFKASGDLMTNARRWPFTIEVKRREGWKMEQLLMGKKSPVWGWWRQAQVQGLEANAVPLLWIRQNRDDWRIIMPYALATMIKHVPHDARTLKPGSIPAFVEWHHTEFARGKADVGKLHPSMVLAQRFLDVPASIFASPV